MAASQAHQIQHNSGLQWEKYQIQFAVTINAQADWKVTDEVLRKALLTQAHGVRCGQPRCVRHGRP
jgi:hypothetical protein